MIKVKFLLAGTAAFLSLATVANAGLIINGSFETPDVESFVPIAIGSAQLTGWTVTDVEVLLIADTYRENNPYDNSLPYFNAQEGKQSIDLTGQGNTGFTQGIMQTVATSINQAYVLSFYVGRVDDTDGAGWYPNAAIVHLSINGGPRMSYVNSEKTKNAINWMPVTYSFIATSESTSFTFLNGTPPALMGGSQYAGLDNVQLQAVTFQPQAAGAVPEPSSIAIFGIGAVVVGAGSYRRRRQLARDC